MDWLNRRFLLLIAVVFGTSVGTGLVFSLEKERSFRSFSDVGGSVLSQTEIKPLESFSIKPKKGINNKKVLAETKQSFDLDQVSLERKAKETMFGLAEALKKDEPSSVYDFLGADLKGIFNQDDFLQSLASFPEIVQVEIIEGPKVFGKWSEFVVGVILENGFGRNYFVVFHFEDGEWKLFGTEEVSS